MSKIEIMITATRLEEIFHELCAGDPSVLVDLPRHEAEQAMAYSLARIGAWLVDLEQRTCL